MSRLVGFWIASIVVVGNASAQAINRFGVAMAMRDGVHLVANIWIPGATGRFPTILIRTPYDKTPQFLRYKIPNYLAAGYAIVIQDTRGRGDSEGVFDFYFPEGHDGFDSIEWIARQPWSNGRIGMDGGSYLGTVQWLAARERPPHLVCIAPTASSGRIFDEIPYLGGAFRLDWALPWLNSVSGRVSQSDLNDLLQWDSLFVETPLVRLDSLMGRPMTLYRAMLAHSTLDQYWQRIQLTDRDFAGIQIPVLTTTGWFDGDQPGALWYWDGMERRALPGSKQFLIIGPWNHGQTYLGGDRSEGLLRFDSTAVIPIQGERIKFFDWCLKNSTPAYDVPRVRVYVTGRNRWRESDRYPLREAVVRSLYLGSGGRANSLQGDGRLTWEPPREVVQDRFQSDPTDPVPAGPVARDHRGIEGRSDVLVYTSEGLAEPVEVVGRVWVRLWAATDGLDTDFTAKLLDVFPDGRAVLLGPESVGVVRGRYRNGYQAPKLLTPGHPEEYTIELFDIGHSFEVGHRIRVEVASSAAPFINPNPNTGRDIATDTTWRVATQTIYHDPEHPSRILLPVIPR